jgi:hypothetical protein
MRARCEGWSEGNPGAVPYATDQIRGLREEGRLMDHKEGIEVERLVRHGLTPDEAFDVRNRFATAKEGKVKNVMSLFGIGSPVTYVDSTGHVRPALVTNCFGPLESKPSINVVVVNDDDNQTDTYGRKIERFTSVVHQDNQYAHGNYWKPISE